MTSLLYVSALLIVLVGIAHSVLGERYILIRLFRRDELPKLFGGTAFTKRTLRLAWHITTVTWFALAALLIQVAQGGLTPVGTVQVIGYASIASGLLSLVISRGQHLSWLVFFAVGAMLLVWAA
jgi:hypothetical protein